MNFRKIFLLGSLCLFTSTGAAAVYEAISEQSINEAFEAGQYHEAVELCKTMLEELDEEENTFVNFSRSLQLKRIIADSYLNLKLHDEALAVYSEIVESYELWRDQDNSFSKTEMEEFFSSMIYVYKESAFLAYMSGYNDTSFQISELSRMRNLVDKFSEDSLYRGGLFQDEEVKKLNDYEAGIAAYEDRIVETEVHVEKEKLSSLKVSLSALEEEYMSYKKQLENKYSQYRRMLQSRRHNALKFSKYTQVLQEGTQLIEFSLYPEKNIILVYILNSQNNISIVNISIDENFLDKCDLYHELLSYPSVETMGADNKYIWKLTGDRLMISNTRKAPEKGAKVVNSTKEFRAIRNNLSQYIGDTLLSPISEDISKTDILIIVPDGNLNSIPFETLQFNGKLLINSFDISYVPSFAVLKLMNDRGKENMHSAGRKDFFAMGNPVYGEEAGMNSQRNISNTIIRRNPGTRGVDLTQIKWNNLPGTKKELEQVAGLFAKNKRTVYEGSEASESRLKSLSKAGELEKYKYLLFATHGMFVPDIPELSSIVLSQGIDKFEDGYITVEEWMSYKLGSDLIYLSACESGLGKYQVGEGVIGIPYALCVAGNKDTVMSLWKVADNQAAAFSASFFEKISKGEEALKAFNAVKREFIANKNAKYNDPSVWSAFLLYGI